MPYVSSQQVVCGGSSYKPEHDMTWVLQLCVSVYDRNSGGSKGCGGQGVTAPREAVPPSCALL